MSCRRVSWAACSAARVETGITTAVASKTRRMAPALHAPELVPVKSFVNTALAMKLRGNGTNYVHIVKTIR